MGFVPESMVPGYTRAAFLRRAAGSAVAVSAGGALLAACGDGTSSSTGTNAVTGRPPATPTGEMRIGMYNPVASIDPARKGDYPSYWVTEAAYDGLTNWAQDPTRLAPGLATAWESNADATEWTFTLREGVRFHDGEPLTSEAVKKSFEHYLRGKGSYMGAYVGEFSEIDTSDPLTAVVKYREPFPDLARNAPWLGLISAKALTGTPDEVAKRLDGGSAGAGAFRISRSTDGGTVTGTAFADYWGDGPYIETLTFRAIQEPAARVSALRSGDLDWIPQVDPQQLAALKGSFTTSGQVSWLQYMIIYACDIAPTDDPRARQAIAYAVDRETILKAVLQGEGEVAESYMPPGCYGSSPIEPAYDFDPERARALVAEVGGDMPEVIVLRSTDQEIATRMGDVIARMLNDAGIKAKAIAGTSATFANEYDASKKRQTHLMLAQFGWINGGPFFFAPGGAYNLASLARFRDPEFEALMVRANSLADGPEREAALKAMQDFFAEQMGTLPLVNLTATDVMARDLQGYVTPKDGFGPRFDTTFRAV